MKKKRAKPKKPQNLPSASTAYASAVNIQTAMTEALRLHQAGRFAEAEHIYRNVLATAPSHPDALQLLGLIEKRKGNLTEAILLLEKAVALLPTSETIYNNLGNTYREAGRLANAAQCYEKALAIKPLYADCLNNYGRIYLDLADYDKAVEKFLRALSIQPSLPDAHNNLGAAYHKQYRFNDAIAAYRRAIELKPDYAVAHYNLGNLLTDTGDLEQSIHHYRESVRIAPDYVECWTALFRQLQATCNWTDYDDLCERLHEFGVATGRGKIFPFAFLALPCSSADQQKCAHLWVQHQYKPYLDYQATHAFSHRRDPHQKLRIGYLSSDFHNHATAYLIAEIFELHDHDRFETYAFSLGPDDGKDMRRRLQKAFDNFIDISGLSYHEAAQRIHSESIDILIDLKGYTRDSGSPIMSFRPAPVQVNYLGYPGTMGASFIDYLITDRFVTPPDSAQWYDETFAYLPDCYQPNDRQRKIGDTPSKADCGLPEDCIIFCCFNHTYKITPTVFRLWCQLLVAVPNSVLWLLKSNDIAKRHLLHEAAAYGLEESRLIFADVMPLEQHLARMQLADMFLDTLPVNAHTTASDALWAGIPVVTCAGNTFISRVAGSLLHTMGLSELVTNTLEDYEQLALRLARDPVYLQDIKHRIWSNRLTTPLFDSLRYTRHLESLYEQMWQCYLSGEPPRVIEPPPSASISTTPDRQPISSAAKPDDKPSLPTPVNIVHIWHDIHKPIFDNVLLQLKSACDDCHISYSSSDNVCLPDAINVLIGSTVFSTDKATNAVRGKRYIVYQMEQLVTRNGTFRCSPAYLQLLKNADWVWDYSLTNISALMQQGLTNVLHVPIGFHRSLQHLSADNRSKDIDVLFYGSLTPRRLAVIESLKSAGINVKTSFGEYGDALYQLIERSKIVLNLHFDDQAYILEEVRLSFLLANRCFVISEHSDHNPYDDGVVFCAYDDIVDTCIKYLSYDDATRQRIADLGHMALRRMDYSNIIGSTIETVRSSTPILPHSPSAEKLDKKERVCIYSLCWLDGDDGYGNTLPDEHGNKPTRLGRTIKWLRFYEPLLPLLGVDKIIFIDDASSIDAVRALGGNIYNSNLELLESYNDRPWLDIIRFDTHLGRTSVKEYPYFWRGIEMIPSTVEHYGIDKLIFIENDCFLLTPRVVNFIKTLNHGFCAFWSTYYNFPESALSVLSKDSFHVMKDFCKNKPYLHEKGQAAENLLPYTHYITQGFCGDRYGERNMRQSLDMDFYAQCPVSISMTYNLKGALAFNIVLVSINDHKSIFEDVIIALVATIQDLGIACTRSENTMMDGAINILIGSVMFASDVLAQELKGRQYILYQMEQLSINAGHLPKYQTYIDILRHAWHIWDYSKANIDQLSNIGIHNVLHVPVGYHSAIDLIGHKQLKDIDVLFYGTLSPRRQAILQQLAAHGVNVKAAFGIYGQERNSLIERSKIIINIHCTEIDTLEEVRLSYLLANRCFIVSESSDHDPYDGGVVFCQYQQLVETCLQYLRASETERNSIAEHGCSIIKQLDYASTLKNAIQSLADGSGLNI